jgi:hypothetical protein
MSNKDPLIWADYYKIVNIQGSELSSSSPSILIPYSSDIRSHSEDI